MTYDLTLCAGQRCPLRHDCYRFRALPSARQDYFGDPSPYDPVTHSCEHLWPLSQLAPTDEQRRTRAYHLWLAAGRPEGTAELDWARACAELDRAFAQLLGPPAP